MECGLLFHKLRGIFHLPTYSGMQLNIYELYISRIFHVTFLGKWLAANNKNLRKAMGEEKLLNYLSSHLL